MNKYLIGSRIINFNPEKLILETNDGKYIIELFNLFDGYVDLNYKNKNIQNINIYDFYYYHTDDEDTSNLLVYLHINEYVYIYSIIESSYKTPKIYKLEEIYEN